VTDPPLPTADRHGPAAEPGRAAGSPEPGRPDGPPEAAPPREPRPWLERLGLASVAFVMASLFAFVALAAGAGGEWILAAMSAVGAMMTIAVAVITVVRG
jgi:hypothetical protein